MRSRWRKYSKRSTPGVMTMRMSASAPRGGGEGVRHARRHDDEVAALGRDDLLAGQELGLAVDHVEHLGRALVQMGGGAVGTAGEGDALGGQCAAGRAAVGQQFDGAGGAADHLGLGIADDHGRVELRYEQRHLRPLWGDSE
jgi:hypothetical protein